MKINLPVIFMKLFYYILIIYILIPNIGYSQNSNNIWCFGDSCLIDFNYSPPHAGSSIIRTRGTCCSISDTAGNLLFYAGDPHVDLWLSGYRFMGVIYNSHHEIMENGDSLAGELDYYEMVIIKDPAISRRYYLFDIQINVLNPGLFYSVIDMSYNNGLGKVVSKNNQIIVGEMTDGISAVKHGNGNDWWVIARRTDIQQSGPPNNEFLTFLINSTGVHQNPIQSIGSLNSTDGCMIRFNANGDKFVFTNWVGLIEQYDFDRCTGIISNPLTIQPELPGQNTLTWSAEYSLSGRYLYISTCFDTALLYQYDTYSTNVSNSRKTINSFSLFSNVGGELKRGPDHKIYFAIAWSFPYQTSDYNQYNMNLSVINQPDLPDTLCDFQPFSFYLGGKRVYYGLPNNPDYDLGPLVGSPCDTLNLGVNEPMNRVVDLMIYPNPSNGTVNIYATAFGEGEIRIVDAMGKVVYDNYLDGGNVSVSGLSDGVYLARLFRQENMISARKFVVIN